MKILFAAHDPGGYNLLEPLIEELVFNEQARISLALIGPALSKAKKNINLVPHLVDISTFSVQGYENELDVDPLEYQKIFRIIDPDKVFVSSSINSNIERYSIKFAQQFGKENFVYIDSWTGETIRFSNSKVSVVPNNVVVCDSFMAEPYRTLFSEKQTSIHIVGNVHLEKLYKMHIFTRNAAANKTVVRILFVTENIAHYFPEIAVNEFSMISEIMASYTGNKDVQISVRPHPLESRERWEHFITLNQDFHPKLKLLLDVSTSIFAAINNSDLVIGVSTMALIESSILGIPAFSYQVGLSDPQMLYIPFSQYNISIIKNKNQINDLIEDNEQIIGRNKSFDFPFLGAKNKIFSLLNIPF